MFFILMVLLFFSAPLALEYAVRGKESTAYKAWVELKDLLKKKA